MRRNEREHKAINKRAAIAILVSYSVTLAFFNFCKVKRDSGNRGYLFPSRADVSNTTVSRPFIICYVNRRTSRKSVICISFRMYSVSSVTYQLRETAVIKRVFPACVFFHSCGAFPPVRVSPDVFCFGQLVGPEKDKNFPYSRHDQTRSELRRTRPTKVTSQPQRREIKAATRNTLLNPDPSVANEKSRDPL